MLNEAKLGRMIKWLGMTAVSSKRSKGFETDKEALEYVINTQIPSGIKADYEMAKLTCPAEGNESLKSQVLKFMNKSAEGKRK